ncbi:hypothetical protein [Streptomyces sp. KMM 9044]|uniref:hypothetical protein n=1 Tax=Streptomyces sp. KMM 9044 TaxID=2744474 RepID=UPI002151D727|nr:hypothetical protein [Streptomyces sp. KMM 9044]WAX79211.1 hypothetical protein HUV60_017555 [Streptomyces sp. KMM 9044]
MDPISVGLLVALATGAAGEAGRQLWTGLTDLVGRGCEADDAEEGGIVPTATGEAELALFTRDPQDPGRARSLRDALALRAEHDPAFRGSLAQWHQQAQALRTGDGGTVNTISGGTVNGPVLQGRDFSGIDFDGWGGPRP